MQPDDRSRGLRILAEQQAIRWRSLVDRFDALVASGAPRRTLLVALSPGLEPTRAFAATRDWAGMAGSPRRTGILVLSGAVGVGKSVAAARYALDTGARWAQATALGQEEYSRAARLVQRLIKAPCLVLDEVGGPGSTTPAAIARVSEVLVQRHAAGRPVVVTTNLDIDEIGMAYDGVRSDESRLADRIRENGAYVECRREISFRKEGGIGPDSRENHHRIATRGLHLFDLVAGGETNERALDELQDLLCCTDDDVAQASKSSGFTPQVQGQIEALLEKVRPERQASPATCTSVPHQASQGAFGELEAIS